MAIQLWTSPITGYRRRGTSVSEVRTLFETGVTVCSIYEPLRACPAQASALEMAALMREHSFDVAGVKEDKQSITRFVTAVSLEQGGIVADHSKDIAVEHLISDATPMPKTFELLGQRAYAFVLVGREVAGIVTRADLNKPPARIYVFGLVSLLEMHLLFWIRKEFGDDWVNHLKKDRLKMAQELFDKRRAQRQELDLCECLQICDKADLIVSQETLRNRFGIDSKTAGRRIFGRIQTLRDLLAHSHPSVKQGGTWEKLIETVVWVDRTLQRSDVEIERLASETSRNYVEQFWSASSE